MIAATMQNNKLLAINKPTGLTSSDVVVKVRRILSNFYQEKVKVGHMGTLDPGAAGVLLVGINKAARLFDVMLQKNKSYIGRLQFGIDTDTLDSYGKIVNKSDLPNKDLVLSNISNFIGNINQVPPKYSALKINGQKAYKLARNDVSIELPTRMVTIENIEVISYKEISNKLQSIDLKVNCSSGTYIRTLFNDIAKSCNVCGYMAYLIRDSIHTISLDNTVTIDQLEKNPDKYFIDPVDVLSTLMPMYELNDKEYNLIATGRTINKNFFEKNIGLLYKGEIKFIGENTNGCIKSQINLE